MPPEKVISTLTRTRFSRSAAPLFDPWNAECSKAAPESELPMWQPLGFEQASRDLIF